MSTIAVYKKIGLIGGMGPEALSDLYLKIIRYFQKEYGAYHDRDFPEFILHSIPAPEMVEDFADTKNLQRLLVRSVRLLEREKCEMIAIACNTVQVLLPALRRAVRVPILGIAEVAALFCVEHQLQTVGILATTATIKNKLYAQACAPYRISVITPSVREQRVVTRVITEQLKGQVSVASLQKLENVVRSLKKRGATAIILGCTELPVALASKQLPLACIDATATYAIAVAQYAKKGRK